MLISRTSSNERDENLPNPRSEALPFNLRTVRAVLRGRLERGEAARRARMLLEDVPRLTGGRLRLRFIERADSEIWPFYVFTNQEYRPDYFNPAFHFRACAIGYGLNWGDLVTLSKVVKFARQTWGEHWVSQFRERMKHFGNHISTVEELWWLGLWKSPVHVQRECAFCAPYWRTVDWQFETQGLVINLEVKYRNHDWLRFVDLVAYINRLDSYFDTLAEKFPVKVAGQVNLVGITLLGSLGALLRQRALAFLESHPALDGFLFWSIARRDLPGCECVLRPSSGFVRELLRPADEEDRWRNPFVIVTRPSVPPTALNHATDFNPLHGLIECLPSSLNARQNNDVRLNSLR
jgi:hypothetical protein